MRKRLSDWYASHFSIFLFLVLSPLFGDEPHRIEISDPLPFRSHPLNYFGDQTDDIAGKLKSRIESGKSHLKNRDSSGYLIDLLKELEIPIESQVLVFSKTSVHQRLVSPKTPRAIYFNDEASVGWVPGAPVIEIAAHDPIKGAMFYTLDQSTLESGIRDTPVVLHREERCLTCHLSTVTMNIPGHLLRSFVVDDKGDPQSGYSPVTHATEYGKRWGGWFVTGKSERLSHLGNLLGAKDTRHHDLDTSFRGTISDLSSLVDLSKYPSKNSDIVALMVLNHQLNFYNLVTRVRFEFESHCRSDAEERLKRYAMMETEIPLDGPVTGSTSYTQWYQTDKMHDASTQSLRELDLKTRLFRNGLSPLVRGRSFRSLPTEVKTRLWKQFREARGELMPADDSESEKQSDIQETKMDSKK